MDAGVGGKAGAHCVTKCAPQPEPRRLRRVRVIPTLLMDRQGRLIKTVKFGKRTYIGDPINAVKIFNTKEVDELVLLDIDAAREGREPNYDTIEAVASEAFMPVAYGGGLMTMDQVVRTYKCGIEKVVLSSALVSGTALIGATAKRFGVQAAVVCLPVSHGWNGRYRVRVRSARTMLDGELEEIVRQVVAAGAGEIILYAIDRDGTFKGYDLDLLRRVASSADVPVVACGGAAGLDDIRRAIVEGHCSAAAAGSMFVYHSRTRGVLISYPPESTLRDQVFTQLN
jgi:cyclase